MAQEKETKPAIKSVTIWATLLTFIPLVVDQLPQLVVEIAPALTPHTAALAAAIGGGLVWVRRIFSANKPIEGVVLSKD